MPHPANLPPPRAPWPAAASKPLCQLLVGAALAWGGLNPGLQAWNQPLVEQRAAEKGRQAVEATQLLLQLMAELAPLDDAQRVARVNDFYNRRIVFRDDLETWGQNDYWASPLETLSRSQGDCEDFAIAKYFSLLAAGVPADALRLVYVQLRRGNGAHMVLAYHPDPLADPWILDNLVSDLRPASRRPDLRPVFSFNAQGLWQGSQGAPAGDPLARLSRWRDVVERARSEGFL